MNKKEKQEIEVQANALFSLGELAMEKEEYQKAKQHFEKALGLFQQLKTPLREAETLLQLGILGVLASQAEEYPTAKQCLEKASGLFQQLKHPLGEANSMQSLGELAMREREYPKVKQYIEKALGLYQQLKNPSGEASTLFRLGYLAMLEGYKLIDKQTAKQYLKEALAIHIKYGMSFEAKQTEGLLRNF